MTSVESANPRPVRPVAVHRDRLDSWKSIAEHFRRDVRTVQRWERDWNLPVHRLPGGPKAGVFAFRLELDVWASSNPKQLEPVVHDPTLPLPVRGRRRRMALGLWSAAVLFLAILAVFAAAFLWHPRLLLSEHRLTPFATSLEVHVCPSWSPDGRSIAFSTKDAGGARLMVQSFDNSPVAVTGAEVEVVGGGDPAWCRPPIWSRDSQALYFMGIMGGVQGLYRVPATGGAAALLQPRTQAAALSPDGRTAVVLSRAGPDEKLRVWVATPPDSANRKLYEPVPIEAAHFSNIPQLLFSPDGSEIFALITIEGSTQYWRLPWPPGPPVRVFRSAERAVGTPSASWLPDSRHVIFSAGGMLAIANVRTERYWPLEVQERSVCNPAPSPDGSRVAYQLSLSHSDVIAVSVRDGSIRNVVATSAREQMAAASPVSAAVAYVTNGRGRMQIWLKNTTEGWNRLLVSGGSVRVHGEPAQLLMTPVFSHDGTRLAFQAVSPAGSALFTVPALGGDAVRVTASPGDPGECCATWAPDGLWLAFRHKSSNELRLAKVRPGSGEAPLDLAPMCGPTMPEWSPSGEWIAFPDRNCRVALMRPDGSDRREIGGKGTVAWSRDGRTLFRIDPETHKILAVEIGTGREHILSDVGPLLPFSFPQPGLRVSVSADGEHLVYSVLRPREEIWILEQVRISEPWYSWLLSLVRR